MNPALLIVDVMNHFDFQGGAALAKQAAGLAHRVRELRDRFDAECRPVIYCNDNWTEWHGDFADLIAACRGQGGMSALLAERLSPQPGHYYILKPRHSAFMATALSRLLDQLRVDRLVITGIAADSCVLATAMDAHMRDYPLWVPRDGTAARTRALKSAAIHLLRHTCGADTRPSAGHPRAFPAGPQ